MEAIARLHDATDALVPQNGFVEGRHLLEDFLDILREGLHRDPDATRLAAKNPGVM